MSETRKGPLEEAADGLLGVALILAMGPVSVVGLVASDMIWPNWEYHSRQWVCERLHRDASVVQQCAE